MAMVFTSTDGLVASCKRWHTNAGGAMPARTFSCGTPSQAGCAALAVTRRRCRSATTPACVSAAACKHDHPLLS